MIVMKMKMMTMMTVGLVEVDYRRHCSSMSPLWPLLTLSVLLLLMMMMRMILILREYEVLEDYAHIREYADADFLICCKLVQNLVIRHRLRMLLKKISFF